MALPKFLQPYLASYDLSKLDKNALAVRQELITQILNSGDDKVTRWLFKNYPLGEIKNVLRQPQRGAWFKESLNYWTKILGINLSASLSQRAIFNLYPT